MKVAQEIIDGKGNKLVVLEYWDSGDYYDLHVFNKLMGEEGSLRVEKESPLFYYKT